MWRQLTSMRTALLLLLLLALAAVPGSLVPQRSADPNGVTQYFTNNPDLAPILDSVQAFDVYTSVWFSSIYLLLFVSLIGCIVPRTIHHARALRAAPPRTPARLNRFDAYRHDTLDRPLTPAEITDAATRLLKGDRYRVIRFEQPARDGTAEASVSAERGYLRETGNLVFHTSLIGILIAVGLGGGFGFTGQRVIVEGQSFINTLASYDSFNPGRFFDPANLDRYSLSLDRFTVDYEQRNRKALGQPIDYTADVTTRWQESGKTDSATIKVNEPLRVGATDIYLLGNGYAPQITVRDPAGNIVFTDDVPFLPQDSNLTSLGVIKVPDGLAQQVGMVGFFYPTQSTLASGAYTSIYPDLEYPLLTLNVYQGDLGLDAGNPKSVYALDTSTLTQLTGGTTEVKSIELEAGQSQDLPGGMGTVSLDSVKRFASFEVHSDPVQGWVLLFSILVLGGLLTSLFIPRRRIWVKTSTTADGAVTIETAGLARGDDPRLQPAVSHLHERLLKALDMASAPVTGAAEPSPTPTGEKETR